MIDRTIQQFRLSAAVWGAALLLFSCSKPTTYEKGDDPLNGWGKYPKYSQTGDANDLIAGQHIKVGTVTYEIVGDVFRVTYNTTDGWEISEAHMWAGEHGTWPRNKPGSPKVGHFRQLTIITLMLRKPFWNFRCRACQILR